VKEAKEMKGGSMNWGAVHSFTHSLIHSFTGS
jgi:hypothetical protein